MLFHEFLDIEGFPPTVEYHATGDIIAGHTTIGKLYAVPQPWATTCFVVMCVDGIHLSTHKLSPGSTNPGLTVTCLQLHHARIW